MITSVTDALTEKLTDLEFSCGDKKVEYGVMDGIICKPDDFGQCYTIARSGTTAAANFVNIIIK